MPVSWLFRHHIMEGRGPIAGWQADNSELEHVVEFLVGDFELFWGQMLCFGGDKWMSRSMMSDAVVDWWYVCWWEGGGKIFEENGVKWWRGCLWEEGEAWEGWYSLNSLHLQIWDGIYETKLIHQTELLYKLAPVMGLPMSATMQIQQRRPRFRVRERVP